MSLTEQKTLHSINHIQATNTLEVKWHNEILRDGEVTSSIPHRGTYTLETKDQFIADINDSSKSDQYLTLTGW
jgi:hypothetical protein